MMLKLVALLALACALSASVAPKPPATHKEDTSEAVKSTPLHPSAPQKASEESKPIKEEPKPVKEEPKQEDKSAKLKEATTHEASTTHHSRMMNHPHITTSHSAKVMNHPVAHAEPKNKVVLVEKKPEEANKEQKH
ncbi:uncharacterized protein LOC126747608 [Anthonomus grandis grandis]|uniref:uncharacterized protein LOC126747608 n=1 Tax=Anthonomus grandis grandis TaxID=2921223 RepID=UPI0021654AC0|nr:uncharacterized protein LOC126747608 [Anthonomus grandis grandis]